MSINKLIEKVTEDWIAKIVCLALAVLIYVFHIVSLLDRKSLTVPLNVVADGILFPLNEIPQNIKVNVRAKSDVIATITSSGISAYLYLTDYTEEGVYNVPVNISLSNELMLVEPLEVFVNPDRISVTLDKKVQKYLPVEPSVSGEPEHGYVIQSVSVVPSSVKVVGPASIVEKTESIYTEKVNVKGAAKGLSAVVGLDSAVKVLEVLPEENFRVTVAIAEEKSSASFKDITPRVMHLSDGLLVESVIPAVSFTVEGPVSVLEKYKPSDSTVFLNCASILSSGEYTVALDFTVPQSLSLVDYSPKSVLLTVIPKNPVSTEETHSDSTVDEHENSDGLLEIDGTEDAQDGDVKVDADKDDQEKNEDGDVSVDGKEEGDVS